MQSFQSQIFDSLNLWGLGKRISLFFAIIYFTHTILNHLMMSDFFAFFWCIYGSLYCLCKVLKVLLCWVQLTNISTFGCLVLCFILSVKIVSFCLLSKSQVKWLWLKRLCSSSGDTSTPAPWWYINTQDCTNRWIQWSDRGCKTVG